MYLSHVVSTKTGTQTCVNWLIRYSMQDVGLKYLHLSTDNGTHVQSLIESCERHMAKETKGIKCKVHRKSKHLQGTGQTRAKSCPRRAKIRGGGAKITPNLTSFHSKIHSKTPLNGSTQRLHSMTSLHKKHSVEGKSRFYFVCSSYIFSSVWVTE